MQRRRNRIVTYAAGVLGAWLVALLVLGFALNGYVRGKVADRLGESLGATATFESSSLALVRGRLDLENLQVRRDDTVGTLSLTAKEMVCDLPPMGFAAFDRECRELAIEGVKLEVSTFALFKIQKPKRKPLRARRVVIEDAAFVFLPSSMIPNLGRTEIKIERAVAGPTTFKTPLSWLFTLQELRASFDVPPGLVVKVAYTNGVMTASGSLFGGRSIELPVKIPVADLADDGQAELKKLVQFGKSLAEEIVIQRAKDWVNSKL